MSRHLSAAALEWLEGAYGLLKSYQDLPRMDRKMDGQHIKVYRCGDNVIRVDIVEEVQK